MNKVYILLSFAAILVCGHLQAQTNKFPSSGSVGIGTTSPIGSLHIKGGTGSRGITMELNENSTSANSPMIVWDARPGGADYLFYSRQQNNDLVFYRFTEPWTGSLSLLTFKGSSGNIGIGTTLPTHKLEVAGSGKWSGNASSYTEINSNNSGQYVRQYGNDGNTQSWIIRGYAKDGIQAEFNDGGVNVNGSITAKEVNVTISGWADYVFEESYHLLDLKTLEEFIAKNKHLPDIPSEKEIIAKGVNMGEMDAKLLAKIEELTLYIIRQKKEIDALREDLSRIKVEADTR